MRLRPIPIILSTFVVLGAVVFLGRGFLRDAVFRATRADLPPSVSHVEAVEQAQAVVPDPTPAPTTPAVKPKSAPNPTPAPTPIPEADASLPAGFNLGVPFTSQAPTGNWDATHEETCEEAAVYMVHAFYQGVPEGRIDPSRADARLLEIVDFEMSTFGYFEDTTIAETARIAREHFGYATVKLLQDPTVEDIKRQVLAGRPVIVPTAGRELGNPNFTAPGPLYHMVVVRGWTADGKFITNDPGTRLGEGYVYSQSTLMKALHDWNGGDVAHGAQVVLVVYPD